VKKHPKSYRRILLLLAIAAALGIGVAGAWTYRKHRLSLQTARWRDEGIRADKSGDYPQAIEKLELSLGRQPDDRDALIAYIDARPHVEAPKFGHLSDTVRALRYLLQQDPSLTEYREKLMRLYQQMGLRTETLDTAETLLKSNPKNISALSAKAQTLTELKRYDEALAATGKWTEAEPLNISAEILKLSLVRQLGHPATEIAAAVKDWGSQHPKETARFELLNAIAFAQSGDRDNALLWLRKAARETPPDNTFSEIVVAQLAELGSQGEDIAILQHLVDDGADASLCDSLLCRKWELGQWKDVANLSAKLDLNNDSTPANLVALVCMARKNLGDNAGASTLTDILARRKDASAAAWIAILRSSKTDTATWRAIAEQCRKALVNDAGNAYLRYFFGESLAATGETELALEAFQTVSDSNRTWSLPPARAAELLLQQGNLQSAAQAAMVSLHRAPNATAALTVARVVAVLDQKGLIDPQTLPKLIDELDRIVPGNEDVSLMRIQSLSRVGSNDKAIEQIHKLLSAAPAPSEAMLLRLAKLCEADHLDGEAEILDASAKLHGSTPQQTLAAAMHDAAQGDTAGGLKRIDAAAHAAPQSAARDWAFIRAQYLDATGSELAAAQWRSITGDYQNDLPIQQAALASRSMRGDRGFLDQTIQRLRGILGEQSLICTLARVRLLVENRASDADDREIADTLRQVIGAHPAMAEPRLLWAESLERTGKVDDAIDQLEMAQRANPGATGLSLKLGALYAANGNPTKALQQLARVRAANSIQPEEALSLARMLAQLGENAKAVDALEHAGSARDNRADLLLAELYWRQNQLDKVESMLPRLLSGGSAQGIEFVARFRASRGQSAEADQALAKLNALKIPPVEKALARGNYYAAVGRDDEAVKQYQQATTDSPKSVPAWRTLVAYLATTGRAADAANAAKAAAQSIPAETSFAELEQSLSHWGVAFTLPELKPLALDYIANPSRSLAARDILSTVARAGDAPDPLTSLNMARALVQRYPGIEGVTLWAAAVELRLGHSTDAAALLNSAMDAFRNSADVAAMTTRFRLARRQWKDALLSASEWRRRLGVSLQADIASAQALVGLSRSDEAIQLLQPYLAEAKSSPDQSADFLLTYADALRSSGKLQQAADLLLSHAADGARWRSLCLQFVSSKLSDDDARTWIRQIALSIDSRSAAETAMLARAWAMLAAHPSANNADRDEAARLFDFLAARSDVSAPLLEQAGMFAEQSGNAAKAIDLYSRSLRMDAHQPIAQNNLAMLIAGTGGNLDEASRHAAAAVEANRTEPAFLDTLATIKARAGDGKAAAESLRRAVDLDPNNPKWRVALAEVFLNSGHIAEASETLSSIDSISAEPGSLSPQMRKHIDELREKISHLQSANVSAGMPLTVTR
jgi:tetratricopeptide (TPR) repeat protein